MKQHVEIEQVVKELTALFEIGERTPSNQSIVIERKFAIDKRKFERLQVLSMLQEYFSDKVINGGYLEIEKMTFVFTTFEVKKGNPTLNN